MSKVDQWGRGERIVLTYGFTVWTAAVMVALSQVHAFFSLIYLFLLLFFLVLDRYLRCTRCVYYGTPCHCFGGLLAKPLFRPREQEKEKIDDIMAAVLLGTFLSFPLFIFLLLADNLAWPTRLLLTGVQLLFAGAWLALHRLRGCRQCKNTACRLYKA